MYAQVMQATANVMTFEVIAYITFGLFIGYIVGVLPGMSRATAIALLVPITYKLPALAGISFLIGVSKGGNTGSALTAILINVPGEPQSIVTALDGYPLTQQGKAQKALKLALAASVLGDFLATLALIILAQPLAALAVGTGPVELCAVLIFAITFIAAVSGHSFYKGLIAGFLGLLLAAPRLDMETGLPRLTFGYQDLYDGVPLLAVAIGTLALSEMLVQIDRGWRGQYEQHVAQLKSGSADDRRLSPREFLSCLPTILRSSGVGIAVGSVPGLGASLSSFLAYAWARRRDKAPETFGQGRLEGVAAAESADNASVPAGFIPMFAIGLPGSASTALLMGAFMLHGLTPGPNLFKEDAVLVYAIFIGMIVASAVMLVMGMVGQNLFARLITVSQVILVPIIVFMCVVGAWLEGGGMFSVYLMLIFAFVGYFMKKFDFSFVTFLIGFILGPMAELSLRQAVIITDGKLTSLANHPVAVLFLLLAVFSAWRFSAMRMWQPRAAPAAPPPATAPPAAPGSPASGRGPAPPAPGAPASTGPIT